MESDTERLRIIQGHHGLVPRYDAPAKLSNDRTAVMLLLENEFDRALSDADP
jgi:hypothetical protein